MLCDHCRETGHWKHHCPLLQSRGKNALQRQFVYRYKINIIKTQNK